MKEASQENEILQKTKKYTTFQSRAPFFVVVVVVFSPKRFTQFCKAFHGDAMMAYKHATPIWRPKINNDIWLSLLR